MGMLYRGIPQDHTGPRRRRECPARRRGHDNPRVREISPVAREEADGVNRVAIWRDRDKTRPRQQPSALCGKRRGKKISSSSPKKGFFCTLSSHIRQSPPQAAERKFPPELKARAVIGPLGESVGDPAASWWLVPLVAANVPSAVDQGSSPITLPNW